MGKSKGRVSRREFLKWMAAGGATVAAGTVYGDDTEKLRVERFDFQLENWNANGMRVGLISDMHLDSPAELARAMRAMRMLIAERPDIIALPGDFCNRSDPKRREYLRTFLNACGDAACPVVATLGNHDYWTASPSTVIETIHQSKVKLLRNEFYEFDGVTIAGFDDAIAHRMDPAFLARGRESTSLLGLLHEPDYVKDVPDHVSLVLSGHSHGGQVRLPFGVHLHTPKGARTYVDGYYPNARVPLFVSRGVGTTGPNWRLFCPPQVAVLTLRGS